MSDDKSTKVKDAKPTQPGEGDSAVVTSKPMSFGDHLFIWTMVILVGVIFGIGPSFGLVFASRRPLSSYNVDPVQVERRQRTAETLQSVLDPARYTEIWTQNSAEGYAREYRKAQVAEARGLMPSREDRIELMDEFFAKKTYDNRTYLDRLRDDRRGSELSQEALQTFLAERFANDALDARLAVTPVVSMAAVKSTQSLVQTSVSVDQVILSVTPLVEEVAVDDDELPRAYDQLVARDRFIVPAARLVTLAIADRNALMAAAAEPDDAAVTAWYEAHKADYAKPAEPPAAAVEGEAPVAVKTEYRPLAEVRDQVVVAVKTDAAGKEAARRAAVMQDFIETSDLENGSADAFAKAATEAGLVVRADVEISEDNIADINLGEFGILTNRSARTIGLVAGEIGHFISDAQKTSLGDYVIIRLTGRREPSRKTLEDPGVRDEVRAWVAARRAYPKLLAAAEELRIQAEKAGPGGLKTVFADPAVAAKWTTVVSRTDLTGLTNLAVPDPADETAVRGEDRLVISLVTKDRPVVLASERSAGDVVQVRLVQAVSMPDPEPLPEGAVAAFLPRVRSAFGYGLINQAYQTLQRELGE